MPTSYDLGMSKKEKKPMETTRTLSAKQWAAHIKRPFSTVASWLKRGAIPEAVKSEIAGQTYWEIPIDAVVPPVRKVGRPPREGVKPATMGKKGKSKRRSDSPDSAD